jgi:hypothetical protein
MFILKSYLAAFLFLGSLGVVTLGVLYLMANFTMYFVAAGFVLALSLLASAIRENWRAGKDFPG